MAAALVSQARGAGHLCLELPAMAGKSLAPSDEGEADTEGILLPSLDEWIAVLRQAASVVGVPGGAQPLILTPEGRLYLARYWDYERRVADELRNRAQATLPIRDPQKLAAGLSNGEPVPGNEAKTDWQQVAVYAALGKRLCVITGARAPARPPPWPRCCGNSSNRDPQLGSPWQRPRARRRRG
ncbi:MAG: hypothetical protein M5U12_22665 [Verrucomicrobia bacterium]|nr:hypothetical protein [Verrucomicrobiota bacterium]